MKHFKASIWFIAAAGSRRTFPSSSITPFLWNVCVCLEICDRLDWGIGWFCKAFSRRTQAEPGRSVKQEHEQITDHFSCQTKLSFICNSYIKSKSPEMSRNVDCIMKSMKRSRRFVACDLAWLLPAANLASPIKVRWEVESSAEMIFQICESWHMTSPSKNQFSIEKSFSFHNSLA